MLLNNSAKIAIDIKMAAFSYVEGVHFNETTPNVNSMCIFVFSLWKEGKSC